MRIGIVGAGQLGRMMALSGIPLGLQFTMYDRSSDVPGAAVAPVVAGRFDDLRRLARFAQGVDVVTFDWENVPVGIGACDRETRAGLAAAAGARREPGPLARKTPVPPPRHSACADRARWIRARSERCAIAALGTAGNPEDAPTRLRRQRTGALRQPADANRAWQRLQGEAAGLRTVRAVHARGVVDRRARSPPEGSHSIRLPKIATSTASWRNRARRFGTPALQRAAERHHRRLMQALGYVGVLCVEYFVLRGRLVANEMAPRVHNSGHWTIEGAETSQFENHVRAVAGLPLGSDASARPRGHVQPDRHVCRRCASRCSSYPARTCMTTARRRGRAGNSAT